MIAFRAAILCTPKARTMVTIAGNPSGTAATASVTAVINIPNGSCPRRTPITKMPTQIRMTEKPNCFPKTFSFFCKGVISALLS